MTDPELLPVTHRTTVWAQCKLCGRHPNTHPDLGPVHVFHRGSGGRWRVTLCSACVATIAEVTPPA